MTIPCLRQTFKVGIQNLVGFNKNFVSYDRKCFAMRSTSQAPVKTRSNGFHGVSGVVLSTNCRCLHDKFAKDVGKPFCRELLDVFRYSFLSRPGLKVKTVLLNLPFIHCFVFLVREYILIGLIIYMQKFHYVDCLRARQLIPNQYRKLKLSAKSWN